MHLLPSSTCVHVAESGLEFRRAFGNTSTMHYMCTHFMHFLPSLSILLSLSHAGLSSCSVGHFLSLHKAPLIQVCDLAYYLWQSRVEIEHYFVACLDHVTVFKVLQRNTTIKSGTM